MEETMAGAHAPIVVTHEGGLKFAANIRGHRVLTDQPVGVGEDAAPMPLELLGGALGTCVALYVQQFCQSRNLDHEGMRVEVQQIGARNPSRVGLFDVRVLLPGSLPPQYAEMLERVARSCPAHHTLVEGAEVAVRIEMGAVTGA
jgi:putative redox protein